MSTARFALGQVVDAPGALKALEKACEDPVKLLARHVTATGANSTSMTEKKTNSPSNTGSYSLGVHATNRHSALDHHGSRSERYYVVIALGVLMAQADTLQTCLLFLLSFSEGGNVWR